MNKLNIAWAGLITLVGCTAEVGSDPGALGSGASGSIDAGGTASTFAGSVTGGNVATAAGSGSIGGSGSTSNPGGPLGGGGAPAMGGAGSGGACSVAVLPPTVQAMLNNRCATCHGSVPLPMLPSLVSYATLTAPSKTDPTKTNAVMSLARLQNALMPMPPAPGAPASAAEIAALQDFINQGYPKPTCPTGGGGGGAGGSGGMDPGAGGSTGMPTNDPLNAMPTCTSKSNWTGGNRGSASMNPGMACISCHSKGEGPSFSIAGTVYPTGHEPDKCNSTVGTAGARVVIIGADGQSITLTPNSVGNFSSRTAIKMPYQAKVTYMGRERLMITKQTSGDCNSCHGQNGSMMAPGRITTP